MMADNSSEGNKDSSTEWDSANNGGFFLHTALPNHQIRRKSKSRPDAPHHYLQVDQSHPTKKFKK